MGSRVIIVGEGADDQVQVIDALLVARGCQVIRWDVGAWPGRQALSLTVGAPDPELDVARAWIRGVGLRPDEARFEAALREHPYTLIEQLRALRSLVRSCLRTLDARGVELVNPLPTLGLGHLRPWQLRRLADADVPVLPTLVTTDDAAALAFVARHREVTLRPLIGGAARIVRADAPAWVARLEHAPAQLSVHRPGHALRAYVLAGEVIAAGRVHTDALEYRLGEHELERVEPEPAIAAAVVKAARLLGLTFAGVDVRVFDDGFAVHGLNPSPMFTGFDRLAGTDVAERLADHLARPGRTR
ncbi:MAG: hypothetical protein R3A51_02635 [Nannocystaceae bacterium]|nr:hypothetical protein [Myxococcales bacterium]